MLSWIVLVVGIGLAGTGYYMHFAKHRSRVDISDHTTGSWLAYGHFGVLIILLGLAGVVLSILA